MVGAQSIWAFYLSRRVLGTLREKNSVRNVNRKIFQKSDFI